MNYNVMPSQKELENHNNQVLEMVRGYLALCESESATEELKDQVIAQIIAFGKKYK